MLRKVSVGVIALAAFGFSGSAMAANPYDPVTVPITITVQPMTELWSQNGPVDLEIVDANENQNSAKAVAKTLYHLHNIPVTVSVSLDDDIPDNTQFFVLVNPAATWNSRAAAATDRAIGWRREGGSYLAGVTNGFPNQVTAANSGAVVAAFSDVSNAGYNSGDPEAQMAIQYFADAGNIMPNTGVTNFNVVWTIAPQ